MKKKTMFGVRWGGGGGLRDIYGCKREKTLEFHEDGLLGRVEADGNARVAGDRTKLGQDA